MVDLFKYASSHNVSIEISPIQLVPPAYQIRVRRGHYQVNTSITTELLDDTNDLLLFALDGAVGRLDEYINRCEALRSGKFEVVYDDR